MSATANKAPVISLSEGFGTLVVQGPNIRAEMFDDGRIVAYTEGDVQKRHPASARTLSDAASPDALTIGDTMPDRTIYAGVSPDTGRPMYTTPKDSGLCGEWRKAMDHAAGLDAHGHKDWRAPTKAELKVLFTHCAAIGNFNETGSIPGGWYWSSMQYGQYYAWAQRFSDGHQDYLGKPDAASLRCVRG
jgi:hypothetical protein